jgi:hypothetical protein
VHIGKLDNKVYGFQLKNNNNEVVMTHDSDGNIWIKEILRISNSCDSDIWIGHLPANSEDTFK